ncbi:MAG: hypothetical protein ACRDPC_00525 [Solirubrobacteraceae bacterium]
MAPGGGEFRRSVSLDRLYFNPDGTIQEVVQTLSPEARKPVASYRFDESGGTTAADSSGNDRHAALAGDPAHVDGPFGIALSLDGSGQHARLPGVGLVRERQGDAGNGEGRLRGGQPDGVLPMIGRRRPADVSGHSGRSRGACTAP